MIDFLKKEWHRLVISPLRQLVYLMVFAVVFGRLAMHFPNILLFKILLAIPLLFVVYFILKAIIFAWIINPYNTWKERRGK